MVTDVGKNPLKKEMLDTNVSYHGQCVVIFMPRCACASEVYGSVLVCLCVCVCVCLCRLLQLLKDQ